jgi:plastocyanin
MKIAFPLLAIGLLVAGGYFFMNKAPSPAYVERSEAPGKPVVGKAEDSQDPFDITIIFTGEVFEPSELTVTKGTRVRFLNDSEDEVWPAGAVHPTHSLYPEKRPEDCLGSAFDACRGLKKGEFFDYTFNYTGEWRYHDHIRAYYTGVITVTE